MFNDVIAKSQKSLREIEKITGVSYSRLSLILNNKISPSFDTINRIIKGLNLSNSDIIQIYKNNDKIQYQNYILFYLFCQFSILVYSQSETVTSPNFIPSSLVPSCRLIFMLA